MHFCSLTSSYFRPYFGVLAKMRLYASKELMVKQEFRRPSVRPCVVGPFIKHRAIFSSKVNVPTEDLFLVEPTLVKEDGLSHMTDITALMLPSSRSLTSVPCH